MSDQTKEVVSSLIKTIEAVGFPFNVAEIDFDLVKPVCCAPTLYFRKVPSFEGVAIDICPSCNQEMWNTTLNKKFISENKNAIAYCFPCVYLSAKTQGKSILENCVDISSDNSEGAH
jgi:hypothetical protein